MSAEAKAKPKEKLCICVHEDASECARIRHEMPKTEKKYNLDCRCECHGTAHLAERAKDREAEIKRRQELKKSQIEARDARRAARVKEIEAKEKERVEKLADAEKGEKEAQKPK